MNIVKEIKKLMIEEGISLANLNLELNMKNNTDYTPQNLSKKLNKPDIKFGDAVDILDVLGYELKIEKKRYPTNDLLNEYMHKWHEDLKGLNQEQREAVLSDSFVEGFLKIANNQNNNNDSD